VWMLLAIAMPSKKSELGSGSHGSARWATVADAKTHGLLREQKSPAWGLSLGRFGKQPRGADPRCWVTSHVLTCAPTGAGKGVGCVIPNLLQYPGSAIVLDIKGENYAVTAKRRASFGEVRVVDPWRVATPKGDAVNWLSSIDPNDAECVGLARELADSLIGIGRSNTGDSHWDDSAAHLLQGLILHAAALPAADRHIGTVRELLTSGSDELEGTLALLQKSSIAHGVAARCARSYLAKEPRERSGVLSTAIRHTAIFDDPMLAESLRGDGVSFEALKQRVETIYLIVPPEKVGPYSGFLRATLTLALKAMTRERVKPAAPVLFLLDEMAQLGYCRAIEDSLPLLRGYGVRFWLLVQDLSQLKSVYPKWQLFLSNCAVQAFGTQDLETAEYLSKQLGIGTIEVESLGRTSSQAARSDSSGQSINRQATGRALLMPDEIRRMGPESVLAVIQGAPPFHLERLNYLEDSEHAGTYEANPFYS